ncbi:MAG: hypothetical protein ACLQPN_22515 [Bryobacteraceae bacterium]
MTQQERDRLFGGSDEGGQRLAVVLEEAGEKKIEQFKQRLALHVEKWRTEQSIMTQKALKSATGAGLQIAEWFLGQR